MAEPLPDAVGPDVFYALCEEAVSVLLQGPKFVVVCPDCEDYRAVAIEPMAYAALCNEYGTAVDARFARFAKTPPESRCPYCIFRGEV